MQKFNGIFGKIGFSEFPTSAQLKQRNREWEARKGRRESGCEKQTKIISIWQMCMFVENWISDIGCQIHSIDFPFFLSIIALFSLLLVHFHRFPFLFFAPFTFSWTFRWNSIEHFLACYFIFLSFTRSKKNGHSIFNRFQYFMSIFKMICNFFADIFDQKAINNQLLSVLSAISIISFQLSNLLSFGSLMPII